MIKRVVILSLLLLCGVSHSAWGQFYDAGRGRTSTKWREFDSPNYKVVFPEGYEVRGASIAFLLDSIVGDIGYGLDVTPRRLPIILRTDNLYSNGFVVWAPKREELVMTAPLDTYALTWDKQLAIHEWRHVSQITSLKHGITKGATWLLGESGMSVGLFVTPSWLLEGDAVVTETQFAEYGRGLQPDYTVGYRAIFAEKGADFKRLDRWICGSYKNFYPDYYHFGYHTLSAAQTYLGADYFGKMMAYAGTWPIFVVPTDIYLKRHYQTTYKKIARRAFAELDSLWSSYSEVDENFDHFTPQNSKSYTTYQYPQQFGSQVLALKSDLDSPTRVVDAATGKKIKAVGNVSSPMRVIDSVLYYTEYVPHPIFEQVNFSAIKAYNLTTHKTKTYYKWGQNFCVVPYRDGFATISMDAVSNSIIRVFDKEFNEISTHNFKEALISLHGLAYDEVTDMLCYIALTQDGMGIGAIDEFGCEVELLAPSVVSVSGLSASDGTLYFSSIESGKNEIHSLDIQSGVQRRVTTSRFGSSTPLASGDSLYFTTYTYGGNMVGLMAVDSSVNEVVEWSRLPQNILNPERAKWDVPISDSINVTKTQSHSHKANKYRAAFPVHSWAPVSYDPDMVMSSTSLNMNFGVTAVFQSSLSEFSGYATYGWVNESNWLKGSVEYKGLPLTISVGAEYGGGSQYIYGAPTQLSFGETEPVKNYFHTDLTLALPLYLSSNGWSNLLQPSVIFQYTNTKLYNYDKKEYFTGLGQYGASLWWSSSRYTSLRNILPRWGYALRADVSGAFDSSVGTFYGLFARGYLPGIGKNHTVTLRAATQVQSMATYNLSAKSLYLTAVNDYYTTKDYSAIMADYTLPLCYPDWGWDGAIFLKRVSANAFGGYSTGSYLTDSAEIPYVTLDNYTYGLDLTVDFTLIRSYDQSMTFTFAMPNNEFYFGFGYSATF